MAQTQTKQRPEMRERDHLEGCPAERIEYYTAQRPGGVISLPTGEVARAAATTVQVIRCIQCGGERVLPIEES